MRILFTFLCLFLLTGCAGPAPEISIETVPTEAPAQTSPSETALPPETLPPDDITPILESMTIEQRVGQLFLVRCDDAAALSDIETYHLGGFVLFGRDFDGQTPDSLRDKLYGYQSAAKVPLLIAVDEEGGTVTRVSSHKAFRDRKFLSPRAAFEEGGISYALAVEAEKSELLNSLGINVNLGPVCDLATEPDAFMYDRSLGQNPWSTGSFAAGTVGILSQQKVGSVLKHFPGYGNNTDTHTAMALDSRSLQQLEENDLIPFRFAIDAGADAVLVSHTIVEALDKNAPASLSPAVHEYLRKRMGFEGVILTDDLAMEAITEHYGAHEAAVLAVLAGNDLLCSTDYRVQYEAVLAAVLEGRISFDALNDAVRHVLAWKLELGLLSSQ